MPLAELRGELGLRQQDVADGMGLAQTRISKLELSDLDRVEIDSLRRYLAAMHAELQLVAALPDGRSVRLGPRAGYQSRPRRKDGPEPGSQCQWACTSRCGHICHREHVEEFGLKPGAPPECHNCARRVQR